MMFQHDATPPLALVVGCAGPVLTAEEATFFARVQPLGFILFGRNCQTPDQVRALTAALRQAVGRPDAPILIDQEGGRVARLRPPHWPAFPAAATFATTDAPEAAAFEAGKGIAAMLRDVGVTVNCAPVCDVPVDGADNVIGDRAFSPDPDTVARLARAFAQGSLAGGVLPIIKHIPGHGRAKADSHKDLPIVTEDRATLEARDFKPFQQLTDLPLGMSAHVQYPALDPTLPATLSPYVISNVIRGTLGFDGLLFSDDLSMKALATALPHETIGDHGARALAAGIDVVLHCNGNMDEMLDITAKISPLTVQAQQRWERAQAMVG